MRYLSLMRLIASLLLLLGTAVPLVAQVSRNWRSEDRVVIGDWTTIRAVAAGPERVFVVSPDAVLSWSPLSRRWEGPFEPPVPGALERVTAGMIDPLDNSLWLATLSGWVHFQPDLQLWDRGSVDGRVIEIAFDMAAPYDGLFIRTGSGWSKVPRGGFSAQPSAPPIRPVRPATVQQAIASNPSLAGSSSAFLLDPSLRTARLTAAARSFDNLGWFLGTDGVGALWLPDGTVVPERLQFGLPGPVVGAISAVPGGVWATTDRSESSPAALTFVSTDLSEFRVFSGPAATGLPFTRARRLIAVGSAVWAATDAGVLRFSSDNPANYRRFAEADGLPDRRVTSLTSRRGVVVAGTERGLALFTDTTDAEPLAPDYAGVVNAVAFAPDTVWAGTPNGPRGAIPQLSALIRPVSLEESAAISSPIYDFAWMADTLVGITSDQFIWKAPGEDRWVLGAPISGVLGPLRRLIAQGDGFWVAGDLGVGWTRLEGIPVRPLLAGADLPGVPLDLAVDVDHLWVATTAGLVRFRLAEVLP
jgi:hypothetical protein